MRRRCEDQFKRPVLVEEVADIEFGNCVVRTPGSALTKEQLLEWLTPRVAKWWLPDDVVFIDEVPKTSVGKFSKLSLREQFADYTWPA